MSRENSLVSTQWVEDNLGADKVVIIRSEEHTSELQSH